ncbi:glycosyltransferase [Microbaculum sp. FT89]|uniref:glycosyltransferase n=1 Tax=Microbaculum sp. FT89 TaxID=3447298 RepID=UPI003F539B6A
MMASAAVRRDLPLIVVCAGTSWGGIRGSDHHVATELTRYATVLWVDPPVTFLTPVRRRQEVGAVPWPRLRPGIPGLVRLTPTAIPGYTRPGINATTGFLVRTQIRWALDKLGATPAAVMACSLDDVLTGWGSDVVRVLYGTDDYAAGADLMGLSRRALLRSEKRQLDNADVVVAISRVLFDRWSEMGANVHLIPNGVQVDAYRKLETVSPAPDVALPSPVAGLVGHLSARIDIDVLEAISESDCSLLLVGPYSPTWEPERFAALIAKDRVKWVGRRPFEELPGYLRLMDVGLTPYADIPFNRASFPLKTLEYLAAGLPVVSSDLPATQWLDSDLVRVANGPGEFVRAIREAAGEASSEDMTRRRRAFAEKHSWKRRAEEIVAAIGLSPAVQTLRETH